ncbi:cupin domain-containing protein [Streptomyces sp. NPDC026092]|uniref:cupin domain-containing protein n=1 Tax=Streptomyces sp. NPDC026092 TaxID=3154797 RepID=UPI0033D51670
MTGIVSRSFDSADETRPFEDAKGRLDLITTDRGPVGRAVFEPGWQWSKHIKPIAGTDSCQAAHLGYVVGGRMKIVMDDGESLEVGPGDLFTVKPGHDAWVVGDEPCVALDWVGFGDYAVRPGT